MNEHDPVRFRQLIDEAAELQRQLGEVMLLVTAARRQYMRTRSDADREALDRVEDRARDLLDRHGALAPAIHEASGLTADEIAELDHIRVEGDEVSRLERASLTAERVQTTAFIDDGLPIALERIERLVGSAWLDEEADHPHDLKALIHGDEPLSLVKGLRPEGEFPSLHRLRQMLRLGRDYATGAPHYDHFAGASLVPQLTHLGTRLELLEEIGGNTQARLERLWLGASESVDATVFELLVAQANVERGRTLEFIEETHEASPDLRCFEPYPLVIECKRKRALSEYERLEEQRMRALFEQLHSEAERRGIYGRFELRLSVEASVAPTEEIVGALIRQRLAAHPDRLLDYPWGAIAFRPIDRRIDLSEETRLYSPNMLQHLFGWNTDLPEWDGLICRVNGDRQAVVTTVTKPIALAWINESDKALHKRSKNPVGLVGDAMQQIPPGEFAVIYVAQHEGAREQVADRRSNRFLELARELDHRASIRVPILFLVRHYPRALDEGQPDFIENTVRLLSAEYGDPELFRYFAQRIFTSQSVEAATD